MEPLERALIEHEVRGATGRADRQRVDPHGVGDGAEHLERARGDVEPLPIDLDRRPAVGGRVVFGRARRCAVVADLRHGGGVDRPGVEARVVVGDEGRGVGVGEGHQLVG